MSGSKLFFQLTAVGADDFIEDQSCVPPQAPPPCEAACLPSSKNELRSPSRPKTEDQSRVGPGREGLWAFDSDLNPSCLKSPGLEDSLSPLVSCRVLVAKKWIKRLNPLRPPGRMKNMNSLWALMLIYSSQFQYFMCDKELLTGYDTVSV